MNDMDMYDALLEARQLVKRIDIPEDMMTDELRIQKAQVWALIAIAERLDALIGVRNELRWKQMEE